MPRFILGLFLVLAAPGILFGEEQILIALRQESPVRYPDRVFTRILELDVSTHSTREVFSDREAPFLLLNKRGMPGYAGDVIVSAGNRVFAQAVDKRENPGRWYQRPASVYELFLDGSNRGREILRVQGDQLLDRMFVNGSATRLGYINFRGNERHLFIHEITSGRLLTDIPVQPLFPDCFPLSMGWLRGGRKMYYTLETGDVHVTSEDSYPRRGPTLLDQDGKKPEKLTPAFLGLSVKSRGGQSRPDLEIIGDLPDGSYLFRELVIQSPGVNGTVPVSLYLIDPQTKAKRKLTLQGGRGLRWFRVSPSGKYLAFMARDDAVRADVLQLIDLETGREEVLFSQPRDPARGMYLSLIGWIDR